MANPDYRKQIHSVSTQITNEILTHVQPDENQPIEAEHVRRASDRVYIKNAAKIAAANRRPVLTWLLRRFLRTL